MKDFGVIITCAERDFLFAKGCCASVKYFMPDVPICLLIDGDFPLQGLDKLYNTATITRKNITIPLLKEKSFGFGITKMIAFWESPFKHFLLLDSDTCVWGDMSVYANFDNYDAIVDKALSQTSEEDINKWYLDISQIKVHFPDFNFSGYSTEYFNTGVLFATKGIFDIKEYEAILDFNDKHPNVFKTGEMGFLNFMIFRAMEEGRIRVGIDFIQYFVPNFKYEELENLFEITDKPILKNKITTLHFTGVDRVKPLLDNINYYYIKPMIFFRKLFLKQALGITDDSALEARLRREDNFFRNYGKTYTRRFKEKTKILFPKIYNFLKNILR